LIEILTKPFLLRRLKNFEEFKTQSAIMKEQCNNIQPLPPLPPESRISYSFNEIQTSLIQSIVGNSSTMLEQIEERGALSLFDTRVNKKQAGEDENSLDLRDYICLQQIADHPSLLLESEKLIGYLREKNPSFGSMIKQVTVDDSKTGKLQTIVDLVGKILNTHPNDKILIFTNFEKMGHLICDGLKAAALAPMIDKVRFLSGTIKKTDRPEIIASFQKRQGPPVLVAGRKLGSVGWNCTEANHLILVDPWWNPNDDDQCIARVYRLGQTKPVNVYRMHQSGFVADDKMDKLRTEKKAWCELILSGNVNQVSERIKDIVEGKGVVA
jgi:SNF2 family DNA or RNA helicase